uniref:Uncharacterized protein n=1 Tax=Panagrolaimus superbus TaxID=310955 RepID=A0A914YB21_9BILA
MGEERVTFCQIDAELHNSKAPTSNSIIKELNPVQFILNFVNEKSPYIPIFNVPYLSHPHQKITFINVQNEECEKAFKFNEYFK